MVVFLMLILTSFMSAEAQDCSITLTDCPANVTECADAEWNGTPGHFASWDEPQFDLNCNTEIAEGYSFYMEYNLPENKESCWIFSNVQRTGKNALSLWQSAGAGSTYFITPLVYINNDEPISMDILNPKNRSFSWRVVLIDENNTAVWTSLSADVDGTESTTISLDPSNVFTGKYYIKIEFLGGGDNSVSVDRLYFNAILVEPACGGGINFSVTSSHDPGSFFPIGETTVNYTATFIPESGNTITETCEFSVTVNAVTSASLTKEDATCNLDNGKITLQATSSSATPNWKYSVDNGTSWNSFTPGVAITDLSAGTYNITIKDESTGCTFEDVLNTTIINAPSVTAPIPVVSVLPEVKGECSVSVETIPTAIDACGNTINGTTTSPLSYNSQGTYSITWTYDDGNGNTATQTQTVVVDDVTAPVPDISVLPEVNGECSVSVTAPTATDNCEGEITGTTSDPLTYDVQGTYTITWTYDDGNGNISSQTQTVVVDDITAPVPAVAELPEVKGECSVTIANAPVANDNCAGEITGTTNDPLTYDVQGTYTITWTYDDGNGNISSQTQSVVVDDTTAPVPAVAELAEVKGECSVTIANAPVANDNCAGEITGTTNDPLTYDVQGTYTITWTYDDGNGNISSQTQSVVVDDTTAPVPAVAELAEVKGECSVTIANAPVANDNCAGEITGTTNDPLTYDVQGTYTITWTYDDVNGNSSTQSQSVVVDDTTPPIPAVAQLPELKGECSVTASAPTATDNCEGVITGTTSNATTYTVPGSYTIIWNYNDGNGNITFQSQKVTVEAYSAPVPVVAQLPVLTGECQVVVTTIPTATVSCAGTIEATTNDPLTYNTQGNYTITWTYDDGKGNISTQTQSVVVDDTTAPVPAVEVLAEVKGACSVSVTAPTANDNCAGVITGTTTDATTYTVPGTYTINWIYNDGNGNSSSQSQTVTVEAYSAPVPVVAQLPVLTGECQVVVTTIPTATVSCVGTIEATTNDPLTYNTQGNYTITWTYDDGNGNTASQTQTVVVDDTTAPVPVVAELPEVNGECSVTVASAPVANDNCAGTITGTTSDPLTYSVPGTYTINWIFSDGNGNSALQSQSIVVEDTTAPVPAVAELPEVKGECSVTVNAPTATDNCAGVITATTTNPLTYTQQGTHTITWIYNDGNGNTTSQTQTVVIKDTTAPEMSGCIAEDMLVITSGCEALLPDYTSQLSVTDNCNNGITLSQTPSAGTKLTAGNHVVTISATDMAGNTTTCKVNVTVVDETKPVFTFVPENIEIECGLEGNDQLIANWLNSAVATDNCQSITLINDMASLEAICEAGVPVTVTWTATDDSGNKTTASAIITIRDSRIPTFGAVENMTVECDGTGNLEEYETFKSQFVADNVDDVVTFEEVVTPGCGITKSIMVTATATTLTGAQSTATATFTIIDTTSPSLVIPASMTIEANENCEWDAQPAATGIATSSDACSGENGVTVTYQDEITKLSGGQYEIVRTWTATDACGNEANGQQVITVAGTNAAPELTLNSIDIYLTESGEWTLNRWNIEDLTRGSVAGCGTGDNLTYTISNRYFDCSSVFEPQEVTVTATDSNGNSTSGKVLVNVFDTIAPMAFCKDTTIYLDSNGQAFIVPGAINMGGDRESVPAWARHHNDLEGGSIDACGIAFMEISQQLFTTENIGANQVTLTVSDPSGNFATCEAVVTVIDTLRQPNYEEGEDTYYESSEGVAEGQESNTDTNETGTTGQDDSAQESETAEETNNEYTIAGTVNTTFGDGVMQSTGTIEVILMLDGTVVATTVTDEEGNYIFEGLTAGNYEVIVINEEDNQENAVAVTVDAENPVASQVNVVVVTVRDNAIVTSSVQFEDGMQMQVYPNPTQGQVRIDLAGSRFRQAEVTVFNVLGAMVYRQSFSTSSDIVFDLSSEASGMYIVKVDSEGISATRKLILDRK